MSAQVATSTAAIERAGRGARRSSDRYRPPSAGGHARSRRQRPSSAPSAARAAARAAAGAMSTATTSRFPRPWTATSSVEREQRPAAPRRPTSGATPSAAGAERGRTPTTEQPAVQERQRDERHDGERGGEQQVAVGDAERVAEEQAAAARRGVSRRQRQQHAEAEQRRHDDGHRGVAADRRACAGERDAGGGDEQPDRPAEQQRQPGSAATTSPGSSACGQRLGAVGELVEDDPAAERAAGDAEQHDLDEAPGA